LITLIFPK